MPRRPARPVPPAAVPRANVQPWLLALTLALLVLVLLRCVVVFSPDLYWDVDPRSMTPDEARITMIGPAGAAWLNLAALLLLPAVLWVHHRAGGSIDRISALLVLLGAGVCLYQMTRHAENLHRAGAWVAAVALALAALHLAQHERPRRYLVAALAAIAVPLALDAVLYRLVELPATIEMFRAHEADFLRARGWEAGSPQHKLYVRRLESPDATGSFGLSNVLGSVAAALTLLSAGVACAVWRLAGDNRRALWLLPALCAAGALLTLALTNSKGAGVSLVIASGLFLLGLVAWRWRPGRRLLAPAALALVAAAVLAVLARGALGPPSSMEGERSLLFRHHYWQASARMLAAAPPRQALLGVGPADYKDHYSRHKNPLNPEEVTSAHNVFVDYVTMLGVGGLAWSALLLLWLWRAGAGSAAALDTGDQQRLPVLADPASGAPPPPLAADVDVRLALLLAGAVFITQFVVQWPTLLSVDQFLAWSFGSITFIALLAILVGLPFAAHAGTQLGLFTAAAAILVHSQIEMAFHHDGAVMVAFPLVGLAAGMALPKRQLAAARATPQADARWTHALCGAWLVVAIALFVIAIIPLSRQQAELRRAAEALRANRHGEAMARLRQATQVLRTDPAVYRALASLFNEAAEYYAQQRRLPEAERAIAEALATLDAAEKAGLRSLSLLRMRAQLHQRAGVLLRQPAHTEQAVRHWLVLLEQNPYSLQDHLRAADLLWSLDREHEAQQIYRKSIQISDWSYLDDAKQLTVEERALVVQRLQEVEVERR